MANTSSAKKAVRKLARRTAINRMRRSAMRTQLRKGRRSDRQRRRHGGPRRPGHDGIDRHAVGPEGHHSCQYGLPQGVDALSARVKALATKAG